MRIATLLIAVSLLLLPCLTAVCQDNLPPAPPPPATDPLPTPPPAPKMGNPGRRVVPAQSGQTPWLMQRNNPFVVVGPGDYQGKPRMIKGKITIISRLASGVKVASVAVVIDDKPIGSATGDKMGLYGLEFETSGLADGVHTIRSVGADAAGKQVWTATTAIEVRNKGAAGAQVSTPAKVVSKPVKPAPVAKVTPAPAKPTPIRAATKPTVKPVAPIPVKVVKPVIAKPMPAPPVLAKVFSTPKYGFTIRQPAGWAARDKTIAMKPKKAGNGWIEFSSAKAPGLVVNVRRMRLAPTSTADTFAKFNPYVTKWDKKTVLGADAFSTSTDTGNKIIHRLIVVKNGYAWMLNCVDDAGKTSDTGQKLFDSMVASLSLSPSHVTAKQLKAKLGKMRAPVRVQYHAPAVKPAAKPTTKAAAKPAAKSTPKMAPKPMAAPVAKPTAKPAATTTAKPAAKPAVKPVAKPIAKPLAPK